MKIAILGFGAEGQSAHRYFRTNFPEYQIDIYDQKFIANEKITIRQIDKLTDINFSSYDMIIRSPSVPPKPIYQKALADHGGRADKFELTSCTKIFLDKCSAPIIGVTGTKGKGTVCSIAKALLAAAGKHAFLVGNIGTPALDILDQIKPDSTVVYEMSSFQLWDLKKSPQIAIYTLLAPDHLDVHGSLDDYIEAKTQIARHQNPEDTFIYYTGSQIATAAAALSPATHKFPYPSESGAYIRDDNFYFAEHKICSTDTLNLPGHHNKENALAAITAVWSIIDDPVAIAKGLKDFTSLPHRLEFVRELDDVKYYDDNFSSATPALEVAVQAFDNPVILIAGGYDKGIDYSDLSKFLAEQPNLKKIILIGQTAKKIAAGLPENLFTHADTLHSAVTSARELSSAGDVILMSPGCASFDMFKNFSDRGDQFQTLVRDL
ncbi:UDP-N-acetylmuramoyl-L-alanine--D-glutamate ligase [Candidatus Saccharibacteria bacterium]|nr:UDP-N-acetylmuramoyl-L-alanine--D-glutamate ligase [Candidatus Saccharibacteria bacterium]